MARNLPFIVALYLATHLVIFVNAQNATLIDQTCKITPNYALCVSTLNSDPWTSLAEDMLGLTTIMVFHVRDKATQTRDRITGFLKDPSMDPQRKKLLNGCLDRYNTILSKWLKETIEGLESKDYSSARESMAAVPSNVEFCERSFERAVKSPISKDSKDMDDLSKVTYAVVFYLYTGHPPPV